MTPDFFSPVPFPRLSVDVPGLYLGQHNQGPTNDDAHYQVLYVPVARAHQRADRRNTLPSLMIVRARIEDLCEEIVRPHKADSTSELKRQVAVLRRWRLQLESGGFIAPWTGERMS